ncbi:tol-pal system-associated acyl-CoA thioesterase [Thalassovita sp.]|jgi:acyl-CoA thioester hydrolase|uniref:tol-pal system-associated acyl-CoA thioesterase n=1 Tax=Thalassovita sp. TaxID=1979401 RepID=UPI003B5A6233
MHKLNIRVYYEDTDMAGIVYYANYLKFIERGRSEWVADLGIDQLALKEEEGLVFVVRRVEADYLAPAKMGDDLVVETETMSSTGVRWVLNQRVMRDSEVLFQAVVTVVMMSDTGHPARMPANIRQLVH